MQDWVEFITNKEVEKRETVCISPEYILAIQDRANKGTRLTYDCNYETSSIDVTEPYEQVKQKIMDADKEDLSNVIMGLLSRDEYKILQNIMIEKVEQLTKDEPLSSDYYSHLVILNKIDIILDNINII